jgi:hypothetical protein
MIDLIFVAAAAVAGYVLATYTWPTLRTIIVGAEQELAQLKARAVELEAKLRAALGGGQS